jgi:ABC-type dipeptide/oligopeptide/nickel transport system permease component
VQPLEATLTAYYVRRILGIVPMLWVIVTITFLLAYAAPGDPITKMYGKEYGMQVTKEKIAAERAHFGLDRPLIEQYLDYVGRLLRGDLGVSITIYGREVKEMILTVLPISMQLGAAALVVLFLIGIPLGVLAGLKQNTWIDYLIVGGSLSIQSVPVFVLAPLMFLVLVIQLKVMPKIPFGWEGLFNYKSILPVLLLALGPMAGVIRQTRAGMLEVFAEDYVRTAVSKGLSARRVIILHVLRNALLPVVTSGGMIMSGLLVGSLFVDLLFGIPGFGRLSARAVIAYDYPVVLGTTLFSAVLVISSNLITDLLYPIVDPRIVHGDADR